MPQCRHVNQYARASAGSGARGQCRRAEQEAFLAAGSERAVDAKRLFILMEVRHKADESEVVPPATPVDTNLSPSPLVVVSPSQPTDSRDHCRKTHGRSSAAHLARESAKVMREVLNSVVGSTVRGHDGRQAARSIAFAAPIVANGSS